MGQISSFVKRLRVTKLCFKVVCIITYLMVTQTPLTANLQICDIRKQSIIIIYLFIAVSGIMDRAVLVGSYIRTKAMKHAFLFTSLYPNAL